MKRLLFPASVLIAIGTLVGVAACDPDLSIKTVPGEGGSEGGAATDGPLQQPTEEAGPPAEGGTEEAGIDAAVEHKIDGTNDFTAGEKFPTSSPQYDGYVSWDDKKVYFGMQGADIAGPGSANKWVLIYVDGVPGNAGTATGISYDCSAACTAQQASLPFNAGFHLRWKTDNTYTNLQKWSGSAWTDVGPISTVSRSGTFMEISITRLALGSPAKLKVHMNMLIEKTGEEWTYAGVPSTSFTDGKDPATFAKFYEFDLADRAKAPNTYPLKP
jgi:hypothetical protein